MGLDSNSRTHWIGSGSPMAPDRLAGGGYNARVIWERLSLAERQRMRKVIVIGSPGLEESQFVGRSDVLIKPDPPEGHMTDQEHFSSRSAPEASNCSRLRLSNFTDRADGGIE